MTATEHARAAALLAALALTLMGQTPSIEQSLELKTPGSVEISPDGRLVAYTVNEADWEANEFRAQIWIAVAASGERYQLTRGRKGAAGMEWSPDGRWLAFLSERDGKTQVWAIRAQGGEAVPLTADESGVQSFRWAPDGKRIAYTSTGPETDEFKKRKERYGDFEVIGVDYRNSHLFLVDVPEEPGLKPPKSLLLVEGKGLSVGSFAWSPDGARIASRRTRPGLEFVAHDRLVCGGSGVAAVEETCRDERAGVESGVVAGQQADRVRHSGGRALLLLQERQGGRGGGRGRAGADRPSAV